MRLFVIIILSLKLISNSHLLNAQNNYVVKGIIIDSLSSEPVPHATIRCQVLSKSTSANSGGEFSLIFEEQEDATITVSCVGYKSKTILLRSNDNEIKIRLTPSVTQLDEVIVMVTAPSIEASKIVDESIKQLTKSTKPFSAEAAFQHTIKENDKYVKYLDGKLNFADRKGYGTQNRPEILQEQITYLEKRESLDFGIDRIDHRRSYFDFYFNEFAFLLKNGLKYAITSTPKTYDYYIKSIEEIENNMHYVISAFDKNEIEGKDYYEIFDLTYEIIFYKVENKYSITSYELNYQSKLNRKYLLHREDAYFKIEMDVSGKNSYPNKIEHITFQKTQYDSSSAISNVVSYHQMMFTDINSKTLAVNKNIEYRPDYWANKPIAIDIKNDLSHFIKLEKQFDTQHIFNERIKNQELVYKELFEQFIKKHKGENIYCIFWNNWSTVNDFINAPVVYPQDQVKLIFISAQKSHKDWLFTISGNSMMHYPNFYLPNLYQEVSQEPHDLPIFMLIKKTGEIFYSSEPIAFEKLIE
jgi:hypothetical protein